MDISDRIMYTGCWVVLVLYIITTLTAFAQRSCIAYAASFLVSCLLFIDLSIFDAWFLLPAFAHHVREVNIHGQGVIGAFRVILGSEAAWDVYLIILGTFGSWLAVFNAAGMLKNDGYKAMSLHRHTRTARCFVKSVYRMSDYLGFGDNSNTTLPTLPTTATIKMPLRIYNRFGESTSMCYTRLGPPRHSQATGKTSPMSDVLIWPGRENFERIINEMEFPPTRFAYTPYPAELLYP